MDGMPTEQTVLGSFPEKEIPFRSVFLFVNKTLKCNLEIAVSSAAWVVQLFIEPSRFLIEMSYSRSNLHSQSLKLRLPRWIHD